MLYIHSSILIFVSSTCSIKEELSIVCYILDPKESFTLFKRQVARKFTDNIFQSLQFLKYNTFYHRKTAIYAKSISLIRTYHSDQSIVNDGEWLLRVSWISWKFALNEREKNEETERKSVTRIITSVPIDPIVSHRLLPARDGSDIEGT